MAEVKPHYFSRSAGDTDDNCSRQRFWNTVYGGRGLESTAPRDALLFGTLCHKGIQEIWETGNLNVFLHKFEGFSEQMQWIGRGLLYAYYTTVYQQYQAEGWKLLHAEKECKALIGVSPKGLIPLVLLAQPDLLLQHEETGIVRYVEVKTSNTIDSAYLESWRYHPQLAAAYEAVWQTLGIQVDEFVMQILYKGTYYKDEGRHASVFTSGWQAPDGHWEAKRPQSWKGWFRYDIADVMAESDWHEILKKSGGLQEQVPATPPMIFHKGMVEAWLEQKRIRESEIADTLYAESSEGLDGSLTCGAHETFPQNFLKCHPYKGYPCNFLSLCWNPTEAQAPLQSGKYGWRTPHHQTEKEALDGKT